MTDINQNPWSVTILTLFPELFPGALGASLTGEALKKELWSLSTICLRDFAVGRHRDVDDTPAGGGPGMVLRADVVAGAIDEARQQGKQRPLLYLSPRGKPLTQERSKALSQEDGVILLAGRFEGVDERVLEARGVEEISIGDFVMTGGELPAMCLIDSVVRLLPGVIGSSDSLLNESFEHGLLEHPHYTRPRDFEGHFIPEVLLNGNHKAIEEWRYKQALKLTQERRPDLLEDEDSDKPSK